MKLKKQYISLILAEPLLQAKIADATDKQIQTVILWATKSNLHYKLLALPVLKSICDYSGQTTVDELIEQPAAV